MRKPLPTFQYQRAKAANYLTELELCRDREIQYNLKNRYGTSQKNIPCTPQRDGARGWRCVQSSEFRDAYNC